MRAAIQAEETRAGAESEPALGEVYRLTAILPLFVCGAVAQDTVTIQKLIDELKRLELQQKQVSIGSAVMGPVVKNAPYSAVEVTENTQTLADGTRIHREQQIPVYRDSEGRVRRESSPDQVTIWDPVANVSYVLNPKTQTARKMPLGMNYAYAGKGGERVFEFRATPGALPPPPPAGEASVQVATDGAGTVLTLPARSAAKDAPKSESLGKQMIEGLNADGNTYHFDAGHRRHRQ